MPEACRVVLVAIATVLGATAARAETTVTHGPLLGRVTESSIVVWARTSRVATLGFRYGTHPDRLESRSPTARTSPAHDLTAAIELGVLRQDTRYHAQALVDGKPAGPLATWRTLPSADAVRDPVHNPKGLFNFKFQFGSCANQNPAHGIGPALPLYQTMLRALADDVSFGIMNGDLIYEEARDLPVASWLTQVGLGADATPAVVRIAPTIVGVWENYKIYLSRGTNLAAWHRRVPSVFTFDDHELVNDLRGAGTIGFRERRAVFRDIGVQAFDDYVGWANPQEQTTPVHFGRARLTRGKDVLVDESADFTRLPVDPKGNLRMGNLHVHWGTPTAGVDDVRLDTQPGEPNAGVYAVERVLGPHELRIRPAARADGEVSYSIGRRSYGRFRVANSDFFLLDTKSHRQMHDPKNPAKRGLTMLGEAQRSWLLEQMRRSDADFTFIVSSVNFAIPHSGAGGYEMTAGKDEAWTSLLDEREQLIAAWDRLGKPVIVLTADLHDSFAIRVSEHVWEMAAGPLNSVNHVAALDEGGRPITGPFRSGPRTVDIRWSSYVLPDVPRPQRMYPYYGVVQLNNVFNMPKTLGDTRRVAYPHPQLIVQFYEGRTGALAYAEAITRTGRGRR
jgi:phosphodiesterase/alkaline phosphatase D-like protein